MLSRRVVVACAAIGLAGLAVVGPQGAVWATPSADPADPAVTTTSVVLVGQQIPVDTGPTQRPFPLEAAPAVTTPLISVPEGCTEPDPPTAVFEGKLVANSAAAARYEVLQLRAGTLAGQMRGNLVDIHYSSTETRFLAVGTTYLVGVRPDREGDFLTSKVVDPAPDFAGDAVIGLNDTEVACPTLKDAVRTVQSNGDPVDSGVLTPLEHAKGGVLRALLVPVAVAFVVLVLLVMAKHLLAATGRSLGNLFPER